MRKDLPKVRIGEKVYAKHKNGRYYLCKIVDMEEQMFCEVDFEDGSVSDDLYPEDIKVQTSVVPPLIL